MTIHVSWQGSYEMMNERMTGHGSHDRVTHPTIIHFPCSECADSSEKRLKRSSALEIGIKPHAPELVKQIVACDIGAETVGVARNDLIRMVE